MQNTLVLTLTRCVKLQRILETAHMSIEKSSSSTLSYQFPEMHPDYEADPLVLWIGAKDVSPYFEQTLAKV